MVPGTRPMRNRIFQNLFSEKLAVSATQFHTCAPTGLSQKNEIWRGKCYSSTQQAYSDYKMLHVLQSIPFQSSHYKYMVMILTNGGEGTVADADDDYDTDPFHCVNVSSHSERSDSSFVPTYGNDP